MQNQLGSRVVVGNRVKKAAAANESELERVEVPTAKLEVDMQPGGGRVESIILTCQCGQQHVVHCDYTQSTTANPAGPATAMPAGPATAMPAGTAQANPTAANPTAAAQANAASIAQANAAAAAQSGVANTNAAGSTTPG